MAYPTYYPNQYNQNYQYNYNQGLNWVQGESGAKSWMIGRGETVLLMDSENPVFYLKSSDSAGMPLPLRIFDYSERTQNSAQGSNSAFKNVSEQFVTREEYEARIGELTELIEEMKGDKK